MTVRSAERRWYAAWHPEAPPRVILRAKTAAGLAEWRRRVWRNFPSTPIILDVTYAAGRILASVSLPDGGVWRYGRPLTAVLLIDADGPDLALRPTDAEPFDSEVGNVAHDLHQVVKDLMGGVVQLRRLPGFRERAGAAPPAGAPLLTSADAFLEARAELEGGGGGG